LHDVDDLVKLITGKRIPQLVSRGLELLGEDTPAIAKREKAFDFNDPHFILGVREDAADLVIKAAFRSLARELHPDTGTKPDPAKFQKVTEAYSSIMKTRNEEP